MPRSNSPWAKLRLRPSRRSLRAASSPAFKTISSSLKRVNKQALSIFKQFQGVEGPQRELRTLVTAKKPHSGWNEVFCRGAHG